MKHTLTRRSNLFLMELIIAILFFSLAGALCMQLFLKARTLSAETSNQNHALAQAKSAAAVFEAGDGTLNGISQFFSDSLLSDSGKELCVYYDRFWNSCKEADSKFRMTILLEQNAETAHTDTGNSDTDQNAESRTSQTNSEKLPNVASNEDLDKTSDKASAETVHGVSRGSLICGTVTVFDGDKILCSLKINCYLPLTL